jgi:hypothetical protein
MGGRYLKACGGWEGDYSIDIFFAIYHVFSQISGSGRRISSNSPKASTGYRTVYRA